MSPLTATRNPKTRGWMTIEEVCDELQVARSTFNDWRAKGRGPKCVKLPNGGLRIRHTEFDRWINSLEEAS
ncbi:DNA-binding protein [Halostreptopolyspora alba]|uniref:DNA-binding protein n=2 Tax=Halostreptopolyspora alba TaxID=2487137 RepID=A0A3N0E6V1_9ACTN|nr:DNA-binding protein [Nocardiopsaceae bacterium YIM 96095]